MRLRRPVLLSCLALVAFLTGCGSAAPKTFDAVTVRRPMQEHNQRANASASCKTLTRGGDVRRASALASVCTTAVNEPPREHFVNAIAAADGSLLRQRALAFAVAAGNQTKEQPSSPSVEPSSVASAPAMTTVPAATSSNGVNCGGEYPPCYVAQRESGDQYGINTGNGYFGRWQFALSWGGKLGLPSDITTATPAQEDAAARELWNHGAGASNWGVG